MPLTARQHTVLSAIKLILSQNRPASARAISDETDLAMIVTHAVLPQLDVKELLSSHASLRGIQYFHLTEDGIIALQGRGPSVQHPVVAPQRIHPGHLISDEKRRTLYGDRRYDSVTHPKPANSPRACLLPT